MLYICLSFDYELFMGKNFLQPKEILIRPTSRLLDVMDKNNVKGTFFADVCCPMVLAKDKRHLDFVSSMEDQMRYMTTRHHDVQLHIHPHWFKTQYNQSTGVVMFDKNYYRIHSYGFDKNTEFNVDRIVYDSVDYLNKLLKAVDTNYKCIAFRAGGFAIQPECRLVKTLADNGIRIDSSVAPGMKYLGNNMYYDFSSLGQYKHNYFFNEIEGLNKPYDKKTNKSDLFEVPIGTYRPGLMNMVIDKITSKPIHAVRRGTYMDLSGEVDNTEQSLNNNFAKKIINKVNAADKAYIVLSIDSYDGNRLFKYIKKIAKNSNCKKNDVYMSIIGHPKGFGEPQYLCIKEIIEKVNKNKYMKFVTFRDIYDQLKL